MRFISSRFAFSLANRLTALFGFTFIGLLQAQQPVPIKPLPDDFELRTKATLLDISAGSSEKNIYHHARGVYYSELRKKGLSASDALSLSHHYGNYMQKGLERNNGAFPDTIRDVSGLIREAAAPLLKGSPSIETVAKIGIDVTTREWLRTQETYSKYPAQALGLKPQLFDPRNANSLTNTEGSLARIAMSIPENDRADFFAMYEDITHAKYQDNLVTWWRQNPVGTLQIKTDGIGESISDLNQRIMGAAQGNEIDREKLLSTIRSYGKQLRSEPHGEVKAAPLSHQERQALLAQIESDYAPYHSFARLVQEVGQHDANLNAAGQLLNLSVQGAEIASKLVNNLISPTTASLGFVGIGMAAFNVIFSLLNTTPSPEQIILEQIQELRKEVADIRKIIIEGFKDVNNHIDLVFIQTMNRIDLVEATLRDDLTLIRREIKEVALTAASDRRELVALIERGRQTTLFLWRTTLKEAEASCLPPNELNDEEFKFCFRKFSTCTNSSSLDKAMTGMSEVAENPANNDDELSLFNSLNLVLKPEKPWGELSTLQRAFTHYGKRLSSDSIANMAVWAPCAVDLAKVIEFNKKKLHLIKDANNVLRETIWIGDNAKRFLKLIASSENGTWDLTLPRSSLTSYRDFAQNIGKELYQIKENKIAAGSRLRGIDPWTPWTEQNWEANPGEHHFWIPEITACKTGVSEGTRALSTQDMVITLGDPKNSADPNIRAVLSQIPAEFRLAHYLGMGTLEICFDDLHWYNFHHRKVRASDEGTMLTWGRPSVRLLVRYTPSGDTKDGAIDRVIVWRKRIASPDMIETGGKVFHKVRRILRTPNTVLNYPEAVFERQENGEVSFLKSTGEFLFAVKNKDVDYRTEFNSRWNSQLLPILTSNQGMLEGDSGTPESQKAEIQAAAEGLKYIQSKLAKFFINHRREGETLLLEAVTNPTGKVLRNVEAMNGAKRFVETLFRQGFPNRWSSNSRGIVSLVQNMPQGAAILQATKEAPSAFFDKAKLPKIIEGLTASVDLLDDWLKEIEKNEVNKTELLFPVLDDALTNLVKVLSELDSTAPTL